MTVVLQSVTRKPLLAWGAIGLVALVVLYPLGSQGASSPKPMAYVVCGGNQSISKSRAYRVDLLAGELKGVSEPIDWLGQPWHLAYDPVHSRLYIASMHKMWSSMWPVTALWAHGGEFEVVNRFPTNRENDLLEKARAGEMPPNVPIHEAYEIVVSPNGKTLFVSHAGLAEKEASTAVWNYQTGELKRLLSTPLQSHYSWSPDGNRMASIWPSHEREKQENGSTMTEILPGGVGVVNVHTGEVERILQLEDNKGLHPPWGRIDEPYIHFSRYDMSGDLRIFDRDSGEMISRLQISQLTGLKVGGKPKFAALEGGRLIAVSAVRSTRVEPPSRYYMGSVVEQGYVLLIDVLDRREITRTRVGERCTNVVVAYEEIEQGA